MPAYDRYFVLALPTGKVKRTVLNEKSFSEFLNYCMEFQQELKIAQAYIVRNGDDYPDMKLIDMYFWQKGYEIDLEKQEENRRKKEAKN